MSKLSLNRAKSLFSQYRRVAIAHSIEISSKKNLIKMPFFQTLMKKDDYSKSIAKALLKSIVIKSIPEGETIALVNSPITSIKFLISGEIGTYIDDSNSLKDCLIEDHFIKEGQVLGANSTTYDYTLKTLSKCLIGQITKDVFNAIMIKQNQHESKHDFNFFSNLSLFEGLKKSSINYLLGNSIKREMRKGEILTTQGLSFTSIYIVRKGQIKLSFAKKTSFYNDFDISFFQQLSDENDRFSTQRLCELMPSYDEVKVYPVFIVCNGDIIGDFELKYKMKNYCFSGCCEIDSSIIYEITLDVLQKVLKNEFYVNLTTRLIPKETLFINRLNTVVKNTKRPKSKYVLRIEDKMPKIQKEIVKISFSQSHSKQRLVNEKAMKMTHSFNMIKLSPYINTNSNCNSNIKISKTKHLIRAKRLSTEIINVKEIKNILSRNNHNTFLSSLNNTHTTPIKSYCNKERELTPTDFTIKTRSFYNLSTQHNSNKSPKSNFVFESKKHIFHKCLEVNKMLCIKTNNIFENK